MRRNEIVNLLTLIAAYDGRTVGEGDVRAWSDAASRAGWTWAAAAEAVKAHFAESAARIMPGHVTQRIRADQDTPTPPPHARIERDEPPAGAEHRQRVMAWLRTRLPTPNRNPAGDHADTDADSRFPQNP